jgi:predicted esterase
MKRRHLIAALGLALAAACDSGLEDGGVEADAGNLDAGEADAGPLDAGAPDAGPVDAGPTSPYGQGCSAQQDATGLVLRSGMTGGDQTVHTYYTYVPATYDPNVPIAVIVSLHGAGDTAKNFVGLWETDADQNDFMVLVPEASAALGPGFTWSTTDLAVVVGAMQDIDRCYRTDMHRHILHGFSAGGIIGYWLGLSQSLLFSGLAIASSDLGTAEYYAGHSLLPSAWKIPASIFHGSQDPNFPIAQTGEPSRDALLDAGHTVYWHEFNGGHTTNAADALQMWNDLKSSTSP